MDFVSVIVSLIASAIVAKIVESIAAPIGQWFIKYMVEPVGQRLTNYVAEPVGQWLGYSFHYSNNIANMEEKVDKLRDFRERLQYSIDACRGNRKGIKADVNKWLENVDVIMGKAKEVLEDEEKAKTEWSYRTCLNLKLRHQHSKKAKKIVKDIDEVLKNCEFDNVSYMDYMNFGSRNSIVAGLMVALGDANINMIGVWGMPGVGKTTLVREIAKQVKKEKLFDEVAITTVTQNPDLSRIQGEIADKLDLKLYKETLSGRADLLKKRLEEEKNHRILVILDDIWKKIDLNEIGIPCNGCKLLVTSRNRDILSSEMGTQKDFRLQVLPKEEAWSLFKKLSGDSLKDSDFRSKAIEVSIACAGLPLALVTVAKALKNKCLFEWDDALQQLQRPSPRNQKRMQEVIYSAIKLSFNHLESEELKSFFLLCSQIQVGSSISYLDLLKKCFGLRLFHGISTLEEARKRIYTMVRSLKDSGLLLDTPHTSRYFHMHDLARDVALLIAYETQNVLTMRDDGPVEWPDEDDIKICEKILILKRDIHELPDKLECPKLRFLEVYPKDRDGFFKISNTLFEGMRKLKVLDLTYMRLSSLPSSLNLLTNLQTLCLDQCVLGDIDVIGMLKNLEILSLIYSEFKQLPREIGLLTRLRMLDLSNCTKLEVIPPNVLSCLIQLEELYVGNSFTQWEVGGVNNERASLAELKHLSQLTTLEVHIPDANILPKDLLFERLKRYKICVGDMWDWSDKHENSRALKLKLNTSFHLKSGIKMLLNGIEDLCLDELKGVKSIIYELDTKGFQQLKRFHVQNNAEIEYIINTRGWVIADVFFPVLEIFSLKNMINLEEICHGQLPLTSFHNLRIVKVECCERLKFVFSSSIAKGLSQLQELEIRECSILGAIVIKEDGGPEDRDLILFPQLRHLVLYRLPKLMSFLNTQKSIINDAGEIIPECGLDFQLPILQEKVVFPKETSELPSIDLEVIKQNQHLARSSCKLTNMQTKSRFQNLCSLKVQGCDSLKYLLSSSTARFMVWLKYLYIENCKVMEEILLTEGLGEEETILKELFPQLENLELKNLPILKRFCIGNHIKFPSLKDLWIEKCPKLKSFIFKPISSGITVSKEFKKMNSEDIPHTAMQPLFNEEVAFPSLKNLGILHMENLKIIWHDQLAEVSFLKLQILVVRFCENLMNIFQSNMMTRFQSLKKLLVNDCGSLQEIFKLLGQDVSEKHVVTAIPLKELILRHLPKMKHVWNKDPKGIFSFPNLQEICVVECESLKSLFPVSVARSLMQLKTLHIVNCGVEEIVAHEDGAEPTMRVLMFPKVTHMTLQKLPKLKGFYRGVHTSEWPLLKRLEVTECDQIGTFASKNLKFQETVEQRQLETSIEQPLFLLEEVTFPNLEVLLLGGNYNMKEIQDGQLLEWCFFKLKILFVFGYLAASNWSTLLKRTHNLEELVVQESSWEEIFPYEELFGQEKHAMVLTQLRKLQLFDLPLLTHLWKEDTQPSPIFHNLEILIVSLCAKLKILVPSSVSFQNLMNLDILNCHGLINLVTSSTAKSLVQLKKMRVSKCESLTEVVVGEGDQACEVIAFTQLTCLELDRLPNLASFYSGSFSFEFPSLEEVTVRQCPKMKIFSHGALWTPKLERVRTTNEDKWHWEADLNTTIHWLGEGKL